MKTTVSNMQEQQQQYSQSQQTKQSTPSKPNTASINEEYIDFEEVKD